MTLDPRPAARRGAPLAAALAAALLAPLLPAPADAQGTGRSMDIDASIRSAGMGGASNAVFWGGDPNDWANPALLAHHSGLRWTQTRTRLLPGLAENLILRTRRVTLAGGGLGLLLPVELDGYGTTRLDYGLTEWTDIEGNPAGIYDPRETVSAWGAGASLAGLARSLARFTGGEAPALWRHVDLAAGYVRKQAEVVLAPGPGGAASGDASDWGMAARLTPVDGLGRAGRVPLRLDLAFGYSVINFEDSGFSFAREDLVVPATRNHRTGFAAALAAIDVPFPRGHWLEGSFSPLLSLGGALDSEQIQAGDQGPGYDVERWGLELTLGNVLSLRHGHVSDPLGDIVGDSWGFGVGARLGRFAGARYDWARIPQARSAGLEDVRRGGVTVFVDFTAFPRRGEREGEGGSL